MAWRPHFLDLSPMYSIRQDPGMLRDGGARYDPTPVPSEAFQAAAVLDDLRAVPDEAVPVVLARYAVLRAWLLERERAPAALVRHAGSAAREHLAATPADWPERTPLTSLLRGPTVAGSLSHLEAAAACAEAAGHDAGARALRQAAHRARWPAAAWSRISPS